MAILPPPDRGQPIDVPYLYKIVNALNTISDQVGESSQRYTVVYTRELADPQNLKTSDTKFYASYIDLPQGLQVSGGDSREFSLSLSGFKYPPIVTATPVNTGTSEASNDVTVTISSVTTSRVDGFVRFNSSGTVDIAVNMIAIGVPE